MAGGGSPTRAILYAFGANLGIAIVKGAAAAFTGSSAMLAEAIHSGADTGNQLLLLLGMHRARRPPDAEHPLGYGKVTYFWSFMVAVLLFTVGGLFSLYEGWHKLHATEPVEKVWVALLVLAVAIGLETVSLRACLAEVHKLRGDRTLGQWLRRSRSSELIVVLGEDVAALVGLVIAFTFLSLAAATGEPRYDALGSLAIGALLVLVAVFLAVKVKALLIGRSADPDVAAAIRSEIAADPAIREVFHVITVQVGSQVMLAAKVRMAEGLGLAEAVRRINQLEQRLHQRVPEIGWCFMEPDLAD